MPTDTRTRQYELEVTMDGEDPFVVLMDQRDQAEFELQSFGATFADIRPVYATFLRWTAWHALKRQGKTKSTWDKWRKECVFVREVPAEEGSAPLESGRQDQPAGT